MSTKSAPSLVSCLVSQRQSLLDSLSANVLTAVTYTTVCLTILNSTYARFADSFFVSAWYLTLPRVSATISIFTTGSLSASVSTSVLNCLELYRFFLSQQGFDQRLQLYLSQ